MIRSWEKLERLEIANNYLIHGLHIITGVKIFTTFIFISGIWGAKRDSSSWKCGKSKQFWGRGCKVLTENSASVMQHDCSLFFFYYTIFQILEYLAPIFFEISSFSHFSTFLKGDIPFYCFVKFLGIFSRNIFDFFFKYSFAIF